MEEMRRLCRAYREILEILFTDNPFIVLAAFVSAILSGMVVPLSVWVNGRIFELGLQVAGGELSFAFYIPYLVLFILLALLPVLLGDMFLKSYIRPRCQLILRTSYKGKMLQKLKKLRYEHLESASSMEIIDKAYARAEEVVLALFPDMLHQTVTAGLTTVGILCLFASVKWWLPLVILPPFFLETFLAQKFNRDIYQEMEDYWKKERTYTSLGDMLRSRSYVRENTLLGASDFLIQVHRNRVHQRNREYERFYLRQLRRNFTKQNITKLVQLGTALLLLQFYLDGEINIGSLISLSLAVFTTLFSGSGLNGLVKIFRNSGKHLSAFAFYDKYFSLSEDEEGSEEELPKEFTIEFDKVSFTYPGTCKQILNELTFKVNHEEKISIVGENGEGKSTLIKLLLGLFQPDSGEIRIGGKPLMKYSQAVRNRLFAPVFQDFVRYGMTLAENVGIGDVVHVQSREKIAAALKKAKVDTFADSLPEGTDSLLGREFEGGVDLSGGQWQRIAIARAFMGDKPILILDEPTSQLDPVTESEIYTEFAEMTEGKTALFITHRLASTMITDRILVIAGGRVTQNGTHEELMRQKGLYADMFLAQKQWYIKQGEEGASHA